MSQMRVYLQKMDSRIVCVLSSCVWPTQMQAYQQTVDSRIACESFFPVYVPDARVSEFSRM